MIPIKRFRWVNKGAIALQQWYEDDARGEWRDVPREFEIEVLKAK